MRRNLPRLHVVADRGRLSGGSIYERMISEAVSSHFEVVQTSLPRRSGWLTSLAGIGGRLEQGGAAAVYGLDALLLPNRAPCPTIVIVHHLDYSQSRYAQVYDVVLQVITRRLNRASLVVAVSDVWRARLEQMGLRRVRLIHNAFDVEAFDHSAEEVRAFRAAMQLGEKPIVHLGTPGPGKGVEKALAAMAGLDVQFVASGGYDISHPRLRHFRLPYREYRLLLKASSVAVTMSEFEEGWCRVAHEAMLSGTPVVGSGLGGMRELLTAGGQVICEDWQSLSATVAKIIIESSIRQQLSVNGSAFASQFTLAKFKERWLDVIGEATSLAPSRSH